MNAEQIRDLMPGDVIELTFSQECDDTKIVLRGTFPTAWHCYDNYLGNSNVEITVVSRAPRPLYVNHPRTEPVNGDVVRDDESTRSEDVWFRWEDWWTFPGVQANSVIPARLRLLVDGESGQVVQ